MFGDLFSYLFLDLLKPYGLTENNFLELQDEYLPEITIHPNVGEICFD